MNPRTAEKWVEAGKWLDTAKGVPAIVAQEVRKYAGKALRKAIPAKPRIRIPRKAKAQTPQKAKADLRKELEALCKAIVFTRDCGSPEAREGVCITCRQYRVLQWGHFIPRQKSKWLMWDPRNTGGQCAGCNGPGGRGRTFEYGQAIDRRDGPGSAAALHREAAFNEWWQPNRANLAEKLKELREKYAHLLPPVPDGESPSPEAASAEGPIS